MTRIAGYLCGLGFSVGLVVGGACTPTGPQTDDGTSDTSGDECVPGSEGCACDDGECEPGLQCASQLCIPEAQVTTSSGPPPMTTTESTTEGPGTGTETTGDPTGPGETVGPECDPAEGLENKGCEDPAAIYCVDGQCVGCEGLASCTDVSAGTPACDATSGQCVQCTATDASGCGGIKPVCDVDARTCTGCTDHAQCELGACNLASGACFEDALYVDRAADCGAGTGSPEAPFCEIQDAVATIFEGEQAVILVKPSPTPYSEQVQVGANRTVAIVRDGNGTVKLEVDGLDSMVVNDNAYAYLSDVQISKGSVNRGLFCLNGNLSLDRVQVVDRKGLGIEGVGCTLTVRRSRLYLNLGGGIKLNGGSARVENSFIVSNGGSFSAVAGVTLTGEATFDMLYGTLADNDGQAGVGDSLQCQGAGAVELRNAIVFGQSDATSVNCPGVITTTSVVDSASLTGDGVVTEPALDPSWFVSPAAGNFSIKADTPFKDVGVWRTGDPRVDYDGDARDLEDGAADFVGADRPV